MNDEQLLRYARHILLDELGIEGQERLLAARVLVVGAGGLGSPAALYGHRWRRRDHAGRRRRRRAQQPAAPDPPHHRERGPAQGRVRARHAGGFQSPGPRACPRRAAAGPGPVRRRGAGRRCWTAPTTSPPATPSTAPVCSTASPWCLAPPSVSTAVSVYDLRDPDAPCYHCLFPEADDVEEANCATMGVFAPVVGIIGSMQAAEAPAAVRRGREPVGAPAMAGRAHHAVAQRQCPA